MEYQQFVANVEEEEAWINEKMTLVASEDYGDTLAAIQVRGTGMLPASPLSTCLLLTIVLLAWAVALVLQGGTEAAAKLSLVDFCPQDLTLETVFPWRQKWRDFVNPGS